MSEQYTDSYRSFLSYTKGLELTVLHDEGLYRHIQFGRRGAVGWFGLVTWPGYLAITGDFESYTFTRVPDMFEFFTNGMSGVRPGRINPGYWAEKVVAGEPVREHSPELFTQQVVEYFWENRASFKGEAAALFREIRDHVLDFAEYREAARGALDSFRYYFEDGSWFEFSDWYEWNIQDWSIHYLRACHAIVWGINQYRAAKAVTDAHDC